MNDHLFPLVPRALQEKRIECGCVAYLVFETALHLRHEPRLVSDVSTTYRPCDAHEALVSVVRDRYAAHALDDRFEQMSRVATLAAIVQEAIDDQV